MPQAYPLAWPTGWPRTRPGERADTRFHEAREGGQGRREIGVPGARKRLSDELDRIVARDPVLSSNLPLRVDGTIRAALAPPQDPGVAVYFQRGGKPHVLACDAWHTVAGNIAAIAAHIMALRAIERYGVGSGDRLFTGYLALPAPIAMGSADWRDVLAHPRDIEEARTAWLRLIKASVSQDDLARSNAAWTAAQEYFRQHPTQRKPS